MVMGSCCSTDSAPRRLARDPGRLASLSTASRSVEVDDGGLDGRLLRLLQGCGEDLLLFPHAEMLTVTLTARSFSSLLTVVEVRRTRRTADGADSGGDSGDSRTGSLVARPSLRGDRVRGLGGTALLVVGAYVRTACPRYAMQAWQCRVLKGIGSVVV